MLSLLGIPTDITYRGLYIRFPMQVSQTYDKSVVTDSTIKAVSLFQKSYCDWYLKVYLVTGTFLPNTGVCKLMGIGAVALFKP